MTKKEDSVKSTFSGFQFETFTGKVYLWGAAFRKYSMTSRPTRLKESGMMNPPKPSYDCALVA